jgi:hypothetical protein
MLPKGSLCSGLAEDTLEYDGNCHEVTADVRVRSCYIQRFVGDAIDGAESEAQGIRVLHYASSLRRRNI